MFTGKSNRQNSMPKAKYSWDLHPHETFVMMKAFLQKNFEFAMLVDRVVRKF